jgi:hypothetical protein
MAGRAAGGDALSAPTRTPKSRATMLSRMSQLRHRSAQEPAPPSSVGPGDERAELMMADKTSTGFLGAVLGGIVVVMAMVFLITGGDLGGTKKVESDADLPPVASPTPKPSK